MIPIGTDYRLTRTPLINYALLAANIVLFLIGYNAATPAGDARLESLRLLLYPDAPQLYQFFSSMFLHGNFSHLIGNMIFLWVFGNAINDRFGHIGYLAFYLAGGILAGIGYVLLEDRAPVLGASGAISAVTGAYLVLFPRVRVTLLLWFYIITTFQVSSLVFLLFQFVYNLVMSYPSMGGAGGVAYVAHSSGYVFGIAVSVGLLATRILPGNPFDLLNLIRSDSRRWRFRRMVAQGHDPFSQVGATGRPGTKRWVNTRKVESIKPETQEAREMILRREIAEACGRHDLDPAVRRYLELIRLVDGAVLSQPNQLDVANQLMADEQHAAATEAYERFLKHYGGYEHVADIYLMLGLLYGRYLNQYDRASETLERAIELLKDPRKVELARADLENVRRRMGG
ncbi:MAG: rhomboid family intramembrane serine protease [Phycisphaerae bacterium]|jgi:membrane associated rhomboid family serine protease|nr:rhomboid family intramembrane serine protease [Phycisphaerae bacterium]